MGDIRKVKTLNAPRALVAGFAAVIGLGTLLLWLPISHGGRVGLLDALFTSTSAVCVTGLTVVDTGSDYTLFGQAVILLLIQVGGLGIMTFSTLLVVYTGGAMSLKFQMILKEALNRMTFSNLARVATLTVISTLIIELVGALVLLITFARDMPLPEAVFFSVFHSISAFCNAGFSLFSNSLIGYRDDPAVVPTICALILLGGIGFPVILELLEFRRGKRLSLHTKLVLVITAALIILGTAGIFAFEYSHNIGTYKGASAPVMLVDALFQSITARTAGFNTVDIGRLSTASLFALMWLMFIGASPGGTGGGIKTSTFGIVAAAAWAIIRGRKDVNIFGRRISEGLLLRAFTVALLHLSLVALATMLMLCVKSFGLADTMFEVVSAAGTVGLSTGITPHLAALEKLIIVLTMFCGRLGPLTIAIALVEREGARAVKFPEGNVLIG